MDISPFGLVLKQLHDVTSDQQMLRVGDKLPAQTARVVLQAGFTTVPIGDQNHHSSPLFGEDGMADHIRNSSDVFMHSVDELLNVFISQSLTDDHSGKHGLLLSRLFSWTRIGRHGELTDTLVGDATRRILLGRRFWIAYNTLDGCFFTKH
jgi:hypothetical protein